MTTDYQTLMALAKSTKHLGAMPNATGHSVATNASCGDRCEIWVRVEGDTVVEVTFVATGCVISRAAAAVLAEQAIGPIGRIGPITGSDMRKLLGVNVSPLRERCLTTALKALQNAVSSL